MTRELTAQYDATLPLPNASEEAYAFERALGYGTREACRRAGGKPENGTVTKWESKPHVQARIRHLRALDEEMLRENRARIKERLNLIAFGDVLQFATLDDDGKVLKLDWSKVKDSELGAAISELRFDENGALIGVNVKQADALAAIAQLRDMDGLKAPARTELTGKDGDPLSLEALVLAAAAKRSEVA